MLKPYDHHVISHIRSLLVFNSSFNTVRVWPDKILNLEKFKLLRVLTVSRFKFTRQDHAKHVRISLPKVFVFTLLYV